MSDKKKLKLMGPHGPMVASPNYDIRKVLDYLGIKYRIISEEELTKNYLEHQRTHPDEILEIKPMEIPKGLDEWDNFMYGTKKDE
jgi:hypothetical protein